MSLLCWLPQNLLLGTQKTLETVFFFRPGLIFVNTTKIIFVFYSPISTMHIRRNSTGDKELGFWSPFESTSYEDLGDHFSFNTELEFEAGALAKGGGFGVSSPPLWKTHRSRSIDRESSPLLPGYHHYSNLSPVSRRRAIVDGRRELMGMIENMPESSYELSLKDIVDATQSLQGNEEENKARTETTKQKMNNRNVKRGRVTRTSSMESEAFLIKMFFPTSLGSKKKAKPGSSGRVASLKSPERLENSKERVWWIKCFFVAGRSRSICRSSTSGGNTSSHSGSSSRRYGSEGDFIPGCWSFFPSKKSKSAKD